MLIMSYGKFLGRHNVLNGTCQVPNFVKKNIGETIKKGLRPILDDFVELDTLFDLQDIFQDSLLMLSVNCYMIMIRKVCPLVYLMCHVKRRSTTLWMHFFIDISFQNVAGSCEKWLWIGKEKKLIQAWEDFDQFLYLCVSRKQENMMHKSTIKHEEFSILNAFIKMYNQWKDDDLGTFQTFLRDTLLSLMLGGRDTTSVALT